MDQNDYEDRLIELETKISFDEDIIEKLSDEIAKQQLEIENLKQIVRFMQGKLKDVVGSNVALPSEETPPPHY